MDVEGVVRRHLPGYPVRSVVELGSGLDNTAFEVNGSLIVRFANEPGEVEREARLPGGLEWEARLPGGLEREARLLAVVAEFATVPVPVPVFADAGCLAYPKLPGVPLLEVPGHLAHAPDLAPVLRGFLQSLHGIPLERLHGLVEVDDAAPRDWLAEAVACFTAARDEVPAGYHRPIETFLAAAVPAMPGTLVFSHNDLGIEHVLIDRSEWTVTGIIDWTDAAIVDPAADVGRLYRDLGAAVLSGCPDDVRERAVFHARCGVLEDLVFGLEHGRDAYVHKALRAMSWLFPAGW